MVKYLKLPEEFFEWQIRERKRNINMIIKGSMPGFFVHSPVMATLGKEGINLACKGVGLIVKEQLIEDFILHNEDLIKRSLKEGWKKTLDQRLERLLELYSKPEIIDKRLLGSLEIYGTKTYHNSLLNKECLLMFNDFGKEGIVSYQLDCDVFACSTKSRFYRYVKSVHDLFHMPSVGDYFCAYKFRIKRAYDKSPKGRGRPLA